MSGDRSAPCGCGKEITLTRARLDFPGAWVTCPACGIELTVWQWVARANKHQPRPVSRQGEGAG